jgi:hypothetical protein
MSEGLKGFNLDFDAVEAKFTAVVAVKAETSSVKVQAVQKQAFLDAKMVLLSDKLLCILLVECCIVSF